ncbi:MAG: hypothetical protein HY744_08270 [Deltaproteobacteria bacterium]|nr:hypothetical protein [Deltaproteobacteria bacterium]
MADLASRLTSAAIAVAACLALSGCQGKRLGQCNALVGVMNEHAARQGIPTERDPAKWRVLARELDLAVQEVERVELTIEELKGFRAQYRRVMEEFAQVARDAATGFETGDQGKVQVANQAVQKLPQRHTEVVEALNRFCQGR